MLDKSLDTFSEEAEALLADRLCVYDLIFTDSHLFELSLDHVGHLDVDEILRLLGLEAGCRDQVNDLL